MEKRYRVFVSSAYEDLRAERQEVMQALLALDCIPAGMEFFPAADEAQWNLIRRIIDDCDFYIVIIGDRPGTLGPGGKSYTQLEYEYAVARGKPVMAFLRADPANQPGGSALSPEAKARLNNFRELAKRNKLCAFWSAPQELALRVTQAIIHAKRTNPGGGWIKKASLPEEIFARTLRGRTVLKGVIDAGIKDVELWNLRGNSLPPDRFFKAAQKEILISAATAHATLNEWAKLLKSIAGEAGIGVCFLLLHPVRGKPELRRWSQRDDNHFKNMVSESQSVIRLVRDGGYHERFHFRFVDRLAPFTAIMIDGDAGHIDHPADSEGQLRIHPCSKYSFGSKGGLVIHLAKGGRPSAFDYYAADLRKQWAEGKEDPGLFPGKPLKTR
jgi:hypothetical protein